MGSKLLFINGQKFLKLKEEQVLLRTGAVMELKNTFYWFLKTGKKSFK